MREARFTEDQIIGMLRKQYQPSDIFTNLDCEIGLLQLGCWERQVTFVPRAGPIRTDISAAELRRCVKIATDGRVSRRMLVLAATLEGPGCEDAARQPGMDRQSLKD